MISSAVPFPVCCSFAPLSVFCLSVLTNKDEAKMDEDRIVGLEEYDSWLVVAVNDLTLGRGNFTELATTLTHRRSSGRGGGSLRPRGSPDTAPTRPVRATNEPHREWGGGWSWNERGRRISPHHLPSPTTPRTTIRGVSIAVMQTSRACHTPCGAGSCARSPRGNAVVNARGYSRKLVRVRRNRRSARSLKAPLKALRLATRRSNRPHGTIQGPRSPA